MEKNDRGFEFLVYATLGIAPKEVYDKNVESYKETYGTDDYDNYCILMCAQRAYRDLNRTLTMIDKKGDNSEFSKGISKKLAKVIYDNYKQNGISYTKSEAFNLYNDNESIKSLVERYLDETTGSIEKEAWKRKFHYGQYQKWVNMTFKYMTVIGIIDNADEKELDIPLDSYVMESMSDKGVKFPTKSRKEEKDTYSEYNSVKWSRLTKTEYDSIVESYKSIDEIKDNPMEWEHNSWIIIAEKKKKIIK